MGCILTLALLFTFGIYVVYSGPHILQYRLTLISTPTPGSPQCTITAYMDGLNYGRYDSDTGHGQALVPSLSIPSLAEHREMQTRHARGVELIQRDKIKFLMGFLNKTNGNGDFHVYQRKFACELHEDGTVRGYEEIAFDGKEFISVDKERVVYVPVTQEALGITELWNKRYDYAKTNKIYLENECIQHMKMYLPYLSTDLERKVPPKVKVSSSESESGTKLHCRVYGFYPRDVEVKWIKNGRDEIHSEEAAQILPNPDGTYQIRVSVGVTPEGGATYSCHIDHSSLEKTLVIPFEPNKRSHFYIIPVAWLLLLLLLIILGALIYRKRMAKGQENFRGGKP
eukprot:XP_017952444.1 PREDICTED: zinc-alpha-2-glycoprotein-like [Xenopus tropicalis]